MKTQLHIDSIHEFHQFANLPKPAHPMISLIDYAQVAYPKEYDEIKWVQGFYSIGLKRNVGKKFNYGQQPYDFEEGVLAFVAPQQVLRIEIDHKAEADPSGWLLIVHPDFLWGTDLAKNIKKYDFFGYRVKEALFLSEKEEGMLVDIFKNIEREYTSNIDKFSQNIIAAQIELLLNFAERFYERQFITRKIANHHILDEFEEALNTSFKDGSGPTGAPSVKGMADRLNLSPNYLTNVLKMATGKSTQEHIQAKLIEKAKEKLSTTSLSVSEIAYALGYEHPASFSKHFKNKTQVSPLKFRQSFN